MATNLSSAITFHHPYLWSGRLTPLLDGTSKYIGPDEADKQWQVDYYCALGELNELAPGFERGKNLPLYCQD